MRAVISFFVSAGFGLLLLIVAGVSLEFLTEILRSFT
jgi:hypothetical protein